MRLFVVIVLATSYLYLVNCDSKEAKLQIGVKKRIPEEECKQRTQNGDHLEMHYTVR